MKRLKKNHFKIFTIKHAIIFQLPKLQNQTIVYQFLELIMTIKQIFHFSHIITTIQFVKITKH